MKMPFETVSKAELSALARKCSDACEGTTCDGNPDGFRLLDGDFQPTANVNDARFLFVSVATPLGTMMSMAKFTADGTMLTLTAVSKAEPAKGMH